MLTVVDYGRGNLLSLCRAFEHCGAQVETVDDPKSILNAEKLVLPGVGAFGDAADELTKRNLRDALKEYASLEKPFLGICVGMQLMFDQSEEFGDHQGLGIVSGEVTAIPNTTINGERLKVPHIGWSGTGPKNQNGSWQDTILEGLPDPEYFYYVHSFFAKPKNENDCIGSCHHGGHEIPAIIRRKALWGCQFHPEKSGEAGLAVLRNFLAL
jgi:imidazole glycerol-phosphate synthase subunit HisH